MKTLNLILLFAISITSYAQDWNQISSGTNKKLNTIDFPTATIGYIGGNDSLLLKTINGGATWSPIEYTGVTFVSGDASDHNIINLKFVDELIGYMTVGPYSNGVYKTINGGTSWNIITPAEEPLCYNYGLYFFAEDDGFLGGANCFTGEQIHKVSETGITNLPVTDLPTGGSMIVDIDFLDDNFGLAVGGPHSTGYILKTIDGGETWTATESGLPMSTPLTSVEIINDTLAYIGYNPTSESYGLLVTHDGGETWMTDDETITFYYPDFYCLHESGDGAIYTGGEPNFEPTGIIFEKKPAGFWNYFSVDYPIFSMASYNDSVVWGVGENGYIIVNQNPSTLSLKKDIENLPLNVYPNPTTNYLNLALTTVDQGNVSLIQIHNLSGQIVFETDKWENKIITENLKTGVYLMRVSLNDGQTKTVKFIKN